ncbi:MAG: P-II family nitrogen regulator [Candidatus Dormibacteria bacterium]
MKKVEAVIRPDRLQQVQDALDEIGISGLTVTEVLGCGSQRGYTETYRGTPVRISLQRKIRVEAVIPDDRVDGAVEAITRAARTGEIGDGKIFIIPVEDAVRIRSGERGEAIVEHRDPQHWGH